MAKAPYKIKFEDGKWYMVVTLREMLDRCDLSDTPMLAEIKRLYDENEKLHELVRGLTFCLDDDADAKDCPLYDKAEPWCCKGVRLMDELGIEARK